MKYLPSRPYLKNIVREYHAQGHKSMGTPEYRNWLRQFGFRVPVRDDHLEFPDDFSEQQLLLFVLRWA
jgi:hypothetical protein